MPKWIPVGYGSVKHQETWMSTEKGDIFTSDDDRFYQIVRRDGRTIVLPTDNAKLVLESE